MITESGNLTGYKGYNWGVGLSRHNYYSTVELHKFNPQWHWGTVVLIVPYIGVGTDYYFTNNFYVSAQITTVVFTFFPNIRFAYNL